MDVREKAAEYKDWGIALRREFHMHPELGQQEIRTARRIEEELDKMGIPHKRVAKTNVIGWLEGAAAGPVVALRADIDALPVEEETGAEYRSQTEGVMHACGHDGHIAALLSAARILRSAKEEIAGTVKFIFQSAEELGTGAKEIVASGELDDVDALFGLHIWNYLDAGKVYVEAGPQMTAAIEFQVLLEGKPGHGSTPHLAVDATLPIAALAVQLQTLTGARFAPLSDKVMTLGRIYSGPNRTIDHGGVYNVIQGNSYLEGSIRVFDDDEIEKFRRHIAAMVEGIEAAYGVKGQLKWNVHAGAVVNDAELAEIGKEACRKLWGDEALDLSFGKQMASEDFSEYQKATKTCFAFVGSKNDKKHPGFAHHSSKFDIDEDAIEKAACLHAQLAIDYINGKTK